MSNLPENILKNRNILPTAMRLLVLKKFQQTEHALSLTELESEFDTADKTTLYRTLKTFEKNKLVHSIEDGSGISKYALCDLTCECLPEQAHIHFHCTNCNETFCVKDQPIPSIQLTNSFKVSEVNLMLKGICENCQKRA